MFVPVSDPPAPTTTGLAHVATVSFLAARAAPSAQFWIALAGGIALARAAALRGVRAGYGASAAAMLQTVAVMGPARVNGPLTQALTAPLLGALHRRGTRLPLQIAACFAIRLTHYAVLTAARSGSCSAGSTPTSAATTRSPAGSGSCRRASAAR